MKNNIWGESLKTYVFFNMLIVLGRSCKDTGPKIQMMRVFKRWHHYWKLWISFFFFLPWPSLKLWGTIALSQTEVIERDQGKKKAKVRNSHWPTTLTKRSALSSPTGLVTVMEYWPSSAFSAPSITKLHTFCSDSTWTRPSASDNTYHTGQHRVRDRTKGDCWRGLCRMTTATTKTGDSTVPL